MGLCICGSVAHVYKITLKNEYVHPGHEERNIMKNILLSIGLGILFEEITTCSVGHQAFSFSLTSFCLKAGMAYVFLSSRHLLKEKEIT